MKRRPGEGMPPAQLVTFDGRKLATYDGWCAAFDAWCDQRRAWEVAHPGVDLPDEVLGECPFEPLFPHSGLWSRPVGEDVVRCAEHGLRPDEH
jgi:hypothetical protein